MSSESAQASLPSGAGSYLRSRLGSFLAFAPLGIWTLVHIWQNLSVFRGGQAWQEAVTGHDHQVGLLFTTTIVLAPLLIHTAWGLGRLRMARPNNTKYGFFNNLKYLLQRLSAVGVLLFLGAHITLAFLYPRLVLQHPEKFSDIAHEMRHNAPTLPVYLLGTLGVAYHFANGLYTFAMSWGIAVGRVGMKNVERIAYAVFVLMWAASWMVLYGLWDAGGG